METVLSVRRTVLGQILDEQGRRQGWLAARMGISDGHLSRLLMGEKTCSPARAEQIGQILGLPVAVFYRDGRLIAVAANGAEEAADGES